ncbi:ionotropic glutamate receptor, metazoa, Periplasmic binding protein-like I [Artemisia annua]|uniref:Ionotropic glutamate receptor, metazoa, Periplasmic binding protein-like I n=1 Tax=Artemisia annua TaxID=35608 RepID=A0A2U1N7W8_ARTAN|nr:ionotropic glutamate receptor, metazoa, Periplasmic binding protein-like I [Artemisia annua]
MEGLYSLQIVGPCKRLVIEFCVLTRRKFTYFIDAHFTNNITTATGFSIDVFNTSIHALPFEVPYELIPFANGTYDDLIKKVYVQEIDAILGDSTILANRSQYVDFTATYTDLGVGTLARINKNDMWIFLKPMDVDLWLSTIAFAILTGIVIFAIESMHQGSQRSPAQQIGATFWFILMTLFFTQSYYTATLASVLTVEQFALASKGGTVGFHGDSFVAGVPVSNMNFEDYRRKPYYSYDDYAKALWGCGAHAIIDEYSTDYSMISSEPTTSGFAFIFQKGSPLVTQMSRQIANIREDGTLRLLEKKWFEKHSSSSQDPPRKPKTLNFGMFRGLFLISGISSAIALTISVFCLIRAKLEAHSIIVFVLQKNLMATLKHLLHRNFIGIRELKVKNDPSCTSELFALACGPSYTAVLVDSCVVNGSRSRPPKPGAKIGKGGKVVRGPTKNTKLRAERADTGKPVSIRFRRNAEGMFEHVGTHAKWFSNLVGELLRTSIPMHHNSWRRVPATAKAHIDNQLHMIFSESPVCDIVLCCLASTCLWPLTERLVHKIVIRVCNRFPRCLVLLSGLQGHLDMVLGDMVGNGDNIVVVFGVSVIGFDNGLMLADDDPYKASVFIWLSIHGFWSYCRAGLIERCFSCNFFVIVTIITELAIIGICSLPLLMTPAVSIIVSSLYVLFVIIYAMQLGDVNVVNERTEHEMKLKNLVEYDICISVAMGVFLMGASILWPDFEKEYRRTAEWLRVYEFVAFWTLTAARLLKKGVFYEFNVFIGNFPVASMTTFCSGNESYSQNVVLYGVLHGYIFQIMQLGDVNVVNERTEHEMKLENLVEYDICISVAMGVFLMGASILWPDFEKEYRRTAEWLRVYEFVAFWTLTAARLLKKGVFYEFNVFIGNFLVASMTTFSSGNESYSQNVVLYGVLHAYIFQSLPSALQLKQEGVDANGYKDWLGCLGLLLGLLVDTGCLGLLFGYRVFGIAVWDCC